MKSVTVDGKPWARFDPAKETIELPAGNARMEVIAYY